MKHKYKSRIASIVNQKNRFGAFSNKIKPISYYTLLLKLEHKESFNLFIGGSWCKNCRAIMPELVEVLENKESIYLLDPRPFRRKRPYTDIRKCLTKNTEQMMLNISNHLCLDTSKRENGSYALRVPFIVRIDDGMGHNYFSEEYIKEEMTPEISNQVKSQLERVLK